LTAIYLQTPSGQWVSFYFRKGLTPETCSDNQGKAWGSSWCFGSYSSCTGPVPAAAGYRSAGTKCGSL